MPNTKPKRKDALFARALSGVIARRMGRAGFETVHSLVKLIPDYAEVSMMSAYNTIHGRGRCPLWVVYHLAGVLETTVDALCRDASGHMNDEPMLPTVGEVFKNEARLGRPPLDGTRPAKGRAARASAKGKAGRASG